MTKLSENKGGGGVWGGVAPWLLLPDTYLCIHEPAASRLMCNFYFFYVFLCLCLPRVLISHTRYFQGGGWVGGWGRKEGVGEGSGKHEFGFLHYEGVHILSKNTVK